MTNFINELTQNALDGSANALEAYIELKRIETALKTALESLTDAAYQEADKFTEKTFALKGAEVTKKSAAGRWDYSHIHQYSATKERLKTIEEMAKQAAASAKHGRTIIDDATGEVIEPAIYTEGKSLLAIKLIPQSGGE
jgi:hypothetical protein